MDQQEEYFESQSLNLHKNNNECQCVRCKEEQNRYLQLINLDRIVENLNDWD